MTEQIIKVWFKMKIISVYQLINDKSVVHFENCLSMISNVNLDDLINDFGWELFYFVLTFKIPSMKSNLELALDTFLLMLGTWKRRHCHRCCGRFVLSFVARARTPNHTHWRHKPFKYNYILWFVPVSCELINLNASSKKWILINLSHWPTNNRELSNDLNWSPQHSL